MSNIVIDMVSNKTQLETQNSELRNSLFDPKY